MCIYICIYIYMFIYIYTYANKILLLYVFDPILIFIGAPKPHLRLNSLATRLKPFLFRFDKRHPFK